jgi:hypothetical protein
VSVPVKAHFSLDSISWSPNLVPAYPAYLWTVFFKIDGDTVFVNEALKVQGTATVVGTTGNHGDLGTALISTLPGSIPIPAELGDFSTLLKPIPVGVKSLSSEISPSTLTVAGVLGCVAIFFFQIGTPDDDLEPGHQALNSSLQQALNQLISSFTITNHTVTAAEVAAIQKQVETAVTAAITNAVSTGNKILTWLDLEGQDVLVGAVNYQFSGDDLASSPAAGITLENGYPNPTKIPLVGYPTPGAAQVMFSFHGKVFGDAYPLSLRKILTRLDQSSVKAAMEATKVPFTPHSVNSWADAVA